MRQPELTIPLRAARAGGGARQGEPVTFGVPLPRGVVHRAEGFALEQGGATRPVQVEALDRWGDGSIRWLLAHARVNWPAAGLALVLDPAAPAARPALVEAGEGRLRVRTGAIDIVLATGAGFPVRAIAEAEGRPRLDGGSLDIVSPGGMRWASRWDSLRVERSGPLRVEVVAAGAAVAGRRTLALHLHVVAHASLPVVSWRLAVTNPAGASHPGGRWDLGDPASALLSEVSITWRIRPRAAATVRCDAADAIPSSALVAPCHVFQASSGGERWNGRVHLTRRGRVEVDFRGFVVEAANGRQRGARACPILSGGDGDDAWAIAAPTFWQVAPKALAVEDAGVRWSLFPAQAMAPQELQPGERVSWEGTLAVGPDPVCDTPLAWVRDPVVIVPDPGWMEHTGVVPALTAMRPGEPTAHDRLAALAIDGDDTFAHKRERVDEFGWRHFGDLHADHEAIHHDGAEPLVSHWNNHYDAALGAWLRLLRTGDVRWWRLARELCAHGADIDIYRTTDDKPAYAGGMFWHTAHHVDAALSTHRTYPSVGRTSGGGPSAGQLYNGGFLLAWYLTGDTRYRDVVRELADYVLSAEDGRRTALRWLSTAPTGHMSHSAPGYHGPGRAGANALQVSLNGHRLTGDPRYLAMAETLLRRCIHPLDDVPARRLLDAERRWFYTMFLQVLAAWLDDMDDAGRDDAVSGYARASLLAYARWMVVHERFTLDDPAALEHPTETWAAQELRKADVLARAARHVAGEERSRMLARADEFFAYAIATLEGSPTRGLCRPVVLCLTNGWAHAWHMRMVPLLPAPRLVTDLDVGMPVAFVPQRQEAITRAARAALVGAALLGGAMGAWLVWG